MQRRVPTRFPKISGRDVCDQHPELQYFKMVSNRLSKVHKQITKKKGKNPNLHEGSRDTQRLQSAAARDDKLNRLTSLREKQNKHFRMVYQMSWKLAVANDSFSNADKVFSIIYNRA
jgi:translation machinery-associated protein 16